MPTVLITGCSTGFGREIATLFLDRGWRVVATMRDPARSTLPSDANLRVLPLDVTDLGSIAAAVAEAGEIDVLVNNAGIGWLNPLEATTLDTVRAIFETNLFGAIATMQAVLPRFRTQRHGVIVNVSSSVTLADYPLLSVYTASKCALNALTRTVALELAPLGIRALVVNPGLAPSTAFASNTRRFAAADAPDAYAPLIATIMQAFAEAPAGKVTYPRDVAEAVWRAATDASSPPEIAAGADAVALAAAD